MVFPGNKKYLTTSDFPQYEGKSITFCVTNDCNLRCSYCYIHNKNNEMDMTLGTAKKIIDTMFKNPHLFFDAPLDETNKALDKSDKKRVISKRLIFDFIGGEPFVRPGLIDQISDYIKYKNIKEGRYYPFMFSFSSNGINYLTEDVQQYINKNKDFISIGITIDGTKDMHDACRKFPDGNGSYHIVEESVARWQKDFPGSGTKVTIAPENLPYLSEAIIHLWQNLGIQNVPANVIFEDVWTDEHPVVFERELNKIKDFLLKNNNFTRFTTTLFDESIGHPLATNDVTPPCGGNGAMLHWTYDASFYNCIRYAPTSCKDGKGYKLGDLNTGWDNEAYNYLCSMNRRTSSDDECFICEIAAGCNYCPGAQYDFYGDPNRRSKSICGMHKTRVKVNNIYFEALKDKAKEIDFGDDVIFLDITLEERERILDKSNQLAQLKALLAISNKYPNIDINKILNSYHEKYKQVVQFMHSIGKKCFSDHPIENYIMDWSRNYAVKKELFAARVSSLNGEK